jgi:hypothetical protein
MACKIEAYCPKAKICEIAEVVQGNPCNPYILKQDTPVDYLPGEKPDPGILRYLFTLDPVQVLVCAARQTIRITD